MMPSYDESVLSANALLHAYLSEDEPAFNYLVDSLRGDDLRGPLSILVRTAVEFGIQAHGRDELTRLLRESAGMSE